MSGCPSQLVHVEGGTWSGCAPPQGGEPTGGRLPSPGARVAATTCTSLTWLEPTTVQGRNGLDSKAV
jgi:hypothetical protein